MKLLEEMDGEERKCCKCGTTNDVTFGPDPYDDEVNGNDAPVWECDSCRQESADDT